MPKGRNSRPFLMPRYFDLATDTEIDLDADTDDVEYLGYQKRRVSLDEWFGAQDPAQRERERLDKLHGDKPFEFIHRIRK